MKLIFDIIREDVFRLFTVTNSENEENVNKIVDI